MENALADLAQALRERLAAIRDEQSRRNEAKHIARLRAVSEKIDKLQEKLPDPLPKGARLRRQKKSQCPPKQETWRARRTTQFVSAPTSSPNAGADLRCRATQNPIGSKRNDSCSLKQARANPSGL